MNRPVTAAPAAPMPETAAPSPARKRAEPSGPALTLDPGISLAQELNLSDGPGSLSGRAESGALSSGSRSRSGMQEPEEILARAIVLQAVNDWRKAANALRVIPDHPEALALRKETERFFRSRWFHTLTDLDGEELLARLQKICPVRTAAEGPGAGADARLRLRRLAEARRKKQDRARRAAAHRKT